MTRYVKLRRKKDDRIEILADANFKSNGDYEARRATEEGYRQFADYFKNVNFLSCLIRL